MDKTKPMDKQQWRKHILARRKTVHAAQKEQAGKALADCFCANGLADGHSIIGGYLPMASEIDILPLLYELARQGRQLAVPVLAAGDEKMQFCAIKQADIEALQRADKRQAATRPAALSSAAPNPTATQPTATHPAITNPAVPNQTASDDIIEPSLLLVPVVAVDDALLRLGRGGGHYDRYLAARRKQKPASIIAIGVAYDIQLVPSLPYEAHDEKLDAVITPTQMITATQIRRGDV